jgi:type I restriction enzyme M protein
MKNDDTLEDFISGKIVKATPEEIEAVQIFSRQLVEDYQYPKKMIQTRPQFRVRARPSDNKKEYPVDIAVFNSEKKDDDSVYIIVECKKKTRKDGLDQLKDYLTLSNARMGVWFNGNERLFIRKIEKSGQVLFDEIPNIPIYGQRLEDIGKFKRADLKPTHNLKAIFKSIRNYLAGNSVGTRRDEALAQQLINIIFCKIYDEKFTKKEDIVSFRAGIDEDSDEVKQRILEIFSNVKKKYKEVIDLGDDISLDKNSITYIVGELQNYLLMESERDVISDAFETFIGHALKGAQGQFFTPRNVIKMIVDMMNPTEEDSIIDPACGSGGFLIESLRHVWNQIEHKGNELGWSRVDIEQEKQLIATNNFRGLDVDYFLSKVTKAYMAIVGDGKGGIFCEDSLEIPTKWKQKTKAKIALESFDLLLTNPPFGSKIKVTGESKLKQYDLGHKWKINKKENLWNKNKVKEKESPQILFIERCLQLLRDKGKMAIVLSEGIFGNEGETYVRNWLIKNTKVIAIIDIPIETFLPHTGTKTSVLILQKLTKENIPEDYPIFMAIAEKCGHDRRGKEILEDDIKEIPHKFRSWITKNKIDF